jgi:hypothetical protein
MATATRRKSRKNPPIRRQLFEDADVMDLLAALAKGERLAVAGGEYLVVTRRGEPTAGEVVPDDYLSRLEGRGWVAPAADGESVVCTPAGRKWASIWFRRTYGVDLAQADVRIKNCVGPLLAAKGAT